MPTEDSIAERDESTYRWSGNMFLVLVFVLMIVCEAQAIRGMWFKESSYDYGIQRYTLPLFIAFPSLFLLVFRWGAKRWAKQGQISIGLAARTMSNFGCALMITYICIVELAELAFRAR